MRLYFLLAWGGLLLLGCEKPAASSDSTSEQADSSELAAPTLTPWPVAFHFQQVLPWQEHIQLAVAGYGKARSSYLLFFENTQTGFQRLHTGALLGQLQRVELLDFGKDGQPELLLYSQKDSSQALALLALQNDGQKLGEWQLPYLDWKQQEQFEGPGYFSYNDSLLLHHFAPKDGGDSLHLRYRLEKGDLQALDYEMDED